MRGKRRAIDTFPTPTITEFEEKYVKKALRRKYSRQPELAIRDAALLVFEFLYRCRVSEIVGQTYPRNKEDQAKANVVDVYEGITIRDVQVTKVKTRKVLRVKFRILKRGRRKLSCTNCGKATTGEFCRYCGSKLDPSKIDYNRPKIWEYSSVRLDHPLMKYILRWIQYLLDNGAVKSTKLFDIERHQAWQIMKDLGIMNHTQRHWRATQLADTMDPFELKEALHRATIPFEYVHRSESRRLDKEKKADKVWA